MVGILVAAIGVQYIYDGALSLLIESINDVRLQSGLGTALAAVRIHMEAAEVNVTFAN